MRLKRLELLGFKSFAKKVKLEFTDGITAIVGPNGSGKSNISDAVRWVLGEQSARSLRGLKMEDIIFAGSDGRRPLGMAEVHLTLDNSDHFLPVDFSEVTISRRVYRSGESQFMINRSPCRLKDIHDLFTDTGLGREGYAIIGQGQIDTVLSARSHDRRVLLEETAGIIKYRHRKEESLQKMQNVDRDAERIADILHEINQRIVPLQRDAEKTRAYNQLSSQLRTVELDHFSLQIRRLESNRAKLESSLTLQRQSHQKAAEELAVVEETLTATQDELNNVEKKSDLAQDDLMEAANDLQEAHAQHRLQTERLSHTQQRKQTLAEDRQKREQRVSELRSAIDELHERTKKLDEEAKQAKETLDQLEMDLTSSQSQRTQNEEELETAKTDLFGLAQSSTDARNRQRDIEQALAGSSIRTQQLEQSGQELEEEIDLTRAELVSWQEQLQINRKSWEELERQGHTAATQLEETKKEADDLSGLIAEANQRLQRLRSRQQALKELEENYEGIQYSVRRLLKAKPVDMELIGTVADVIQVPIGWETALEVALGAAVSHVIVPTRSQAQLAIGWLKKQNAGRATFLPLDSIQAQSFPEKYAKYWEIDGVIGPAMNLITVEPSCYDALASILGRVAITQTLDDAVRLQKQIPSFSRIITKEGDVLAPSGAMTGGSLKGKTSGILSRRNEIEQLTANTQEVQNHLHKLGERNSALQRAVEKREKVLADLRSQARENVSHREKTQLHVNQAHSALDKLVKRQEQLGEQRNAIEKEQVIQQRMVLQVQAEIKKLTQVEDTLRNAIQEQEATIKESFSNLQGLQEKRTNAKVSYTECLSTLQRTRQQSTEQKQVLASIAREENESLRLTNEANEQEAHLNSELQQLGKTIISMKNRKAELERSLQTLRQDRLARQELLRHQQQTAKQTQRMLTQHEKTLHHLELEHRGIELELQQLAEETANRDASIEDLFDREVNREAGSLRHDLERLRGEIKALGMVNPAAVEEYEELHQRQGFLQIQYDDLQEARATLKAVIREMDQTSEERFRQTFRLVRKQFQSIFSELFSGGSADLVLTEPEQLLTTGVEVVAQPPGKKLTNLLLLSGGERSLTAIALLFAIRKVKPTPFCILDEIDAALDDANLTRFSSLMKKFAEDTQFLVITHRPGTMEVADALYGVTMEKQAASQLISVKLADPV